MALTRDAVRQKIMVKPRGLNICPVIPWSIARGKNTTQVVAVPPIMDWITMPLPSRAASRYPTIPLPFVDRKQLSSTTMELSTIIPTPSTMLLRVMTFKVKPMACIRIRATRMEMGMEVPTIREARISPKNTYIISMDTITAMAMVCHTLCKEELMESLVSLTTTISRFSSSAVSARIVRFTALDTSMAEALCCFLTPREMVSRPS